MKIYEDLLNLIEEVINELDDSTVEKAQAEREKRYKEALNKMTSTSAEEKAEAKKIAAEEERKLKRNTELTNARGLRKHWDSEKFKAFKERLLNMKPQKASVTQQAGSEHDNAIIDQHFRDKLEKALAVSNECFEEIISLVEGYLRG